MILSRIELIGELFEKLNRGFDWSQRHRAMPELLTELEKRTEPIFIALEHLGIDRLVTNAVYLFGVADIEKLINQLESQEDHEKS